MLEELIKKMEDKIDNDDFEVVQEECVEEIERAALGLSAEIIHVNTLQLLSEATLLSAMERAGNEDTDPTQNAPGACNRGCPLPQLQISTAGIRFLLFPQ